MAKNTKTTNVTNVASFQIGDRCAVATAATKQETAYGTVVDISKSGWFIVKLDDPGRFSGCKDGKLSARISSMAYESIEKTATPAPGSFAAQLASANAPASPKEPKAKPAPKPKAALPTECPECESGELESEANEDGSTTVSCSCGWEDTTPADPDTASRMAEALRKARAHYEKTRRPEGTASADCGDQIAKELRDYEPQDVANMADRVLQVPAGTHFAKYQNLNNGQIRMNSGNRIRGYWKKINDDQNEAEITRVGFLLNLIETPESMEIIGENVESIERGRDSQ